MKQIEIDLDVNRAIENGRISFDESHNQVLRRLLAIDGRPVRRNVQTPGVLRSPRSSGAYSAMIGATPIEGNSLKELLRRVILKGHKLQPGFIDELARLPTARGRHIVARTPQGLYPKSPQLVEYAEPLTEGWWYDTNVGRAQVAAYLRIIAGLLKLPQIPTIVKRSEKSLLTLADLGLE